MEFLKIVLIYTISIIFYLIIPTTFYIMFGKKSRKSGFIAFLIMIAIEVSIHTFIYFNPMVTYSREITKATIVQNDWAEKELKENYRGLYSWQCPLIPYKINVTKLDKTNVQAELYYIPVGKAFVEIIKTNDGYIPSLIRPISHIK